MNSRENLKISPDVKEKIIMVQSEISLKERRRVTYNEVLMRLMEAWGARSEGDRVETG